MLKTIQCILFLNIPCDVTLCLSFFSKHYNVIFLSAHVNFVCMTKIMSIFQKSIMISFLFEIYPYSPIWNLLKFIAKWIILILIIFMLNMNLHVKFILNLLFMFSPFWRFFTCAKCEWNGKRFASVKSCWKTSPCVTPITKILKFCKAYVDNYSME